MTEEGPKKKEYKDKTTEKKEEKKVRKILPPAEGYKGFEDSWEHPVRDYKQFKKKVEEKHNSMERKKKGPEDEKENESV